MGMFVNPATPATRKTTSDAVSRRRFLLIATALAGGAAAACSRKQHSPPITCTDERGLNAAEKKARVTLRYVDHTPGWATSCAKCQQFEPPPRKGSCGLCRVLAGPINPDGYCNAFVPFG